MLRSPFAAKDPYEPAYYLGSWHQDVNPALFICPLSAYVMSHSVGQLLSIPFIFFFSFLVCGRLYFPVLMRLSGVIGWFWTKKCA